MTDTKQFGIRIPGELQEGLQKRADGLNKEFPEINMTVGKLVAHVAREGIEKYNRTNEIFGYDRTFSNDRDETLFKLAELIELKAHGLKLLSKEQFKTVDGLVLYTELDDVLNTILALGTDNIEKAKEIAHNTSCGYLIDIVKEVINEG